MKTSLSANSTHKPSPPLNCTPKIIIFTLVYIYKHPEINKLDNKSCELTVHDISQLKSPFCLLERLCVVVSSVRACNQETLTNHSASSERRPRPHNCSGLVTDQLQHAVEKTPAHTAEETLPNII